MPTALVTGGTAGLGRAFAEELARQGYDLVLVARDEARLAEVAGELAAAHPVQVETIPADLADRAQTLALAGRLADPDKPVDLLVNNAGFALHSSLVDVDVALHARALEVMALAPLILAGAAAQAMAARGQGSILNVGSAAAVLTSGHYSAIKSWVKIWTESLAVELRGTGVKVAAVLPGWMKTEFHSRGNVKANSFPPAIDKVVWVDPAHVVKVGLTALAKGRVLVVPTKRWRFAVWLAQVVPRRAIRWVSAKLVHSRA